MARYSRTDTDSPGEHIAVWIKGGHTSLATADSLAGTDEPATAATIEVRVAFSRVRIPEDHFIRNLLALVPRSHQHMAAAVFRTIFAQPDPGAVRDAWDEVAAQLGARFPKVAALMADAKPEVLAFAAFPRAHWQKNSLAAADVDIVDVNRPNPSPLLGTTTPRQDRHRRRVRSSAGRIGRCQPDPDRGAWRRGLCSWPHRRRLKWISRRATVIRSGQLWPLIRLWRVSMPICCLLATAWGVVLRLSICLRTSVAMPLARRASLGASAARSPSGYSSPSAMCSRGALSWGYSGMCSWSHKRRLKWISRRATVTRLGQLLPSRRL